jgi:hypothetical protein
MLALVGGAIRLAKDYDPAAVAGLLRFYWFRLADVALPLGIALLAARWIVAQRQLRPALARVLLSATVAAAGLHLSDCIVLRWFSLPPHAERFWDLDAWASAGRWLAHPGRTPLPFRQPRADRLPDYAAWREICDWVAQSGRVPPEAVFLTPRMSETFKWYSHRSEAGTWKELPQDARGIVQWYDRMEEFYGTGSPLPSERWYNSLAELGPEKLCSLAAKEHIDYVLTTVSDPLLPLPIAHQNPSYVIYQSPKGK